MAEDGAGDRRSLSGPDRMRRAVGDYVQAVHEAYVRQARMLPPAVQGRLPLMTAGAFSIAAVGTRYLHLIATREVLGSGTRGEVVHLDQEAVPLRWSLHFYDPVVMPALGLLDEREGPACDEVRRLLGVRTHLYHLTLMPPADLAVHHADHTGAGLAGAHAAAARDFEAIRASVPASVAPVVEELEGALIAGLPRAAALLAREVAPGDAEVLRLAGGFAQTGDRSPGANRSGDSGSDPAALRRAVLHAVRPAAGAVSGGKRER